MECGACQGVPAVRRGFSSTASSGTISPIPASPPHRSPPPSAPGPAGARGGRPSRHESFSPRPGWAARGGSPRPAAWGARSPPASPACASGAGCSYPWEAGIGRRRGPPYEPAAPAPPSAGTQVPVCAPLGESCQRRCSLPRLEGKVQALPVPEVRTGWGHPAPETREGTSEPCPASRSLPSRSELLEGRGPADSFSRPLGCTESGFPVQFEGNTAACNAVSAPSPSASPARARDVDLAHRLLACRQARADAVFADAVVAKPIEAGALPAFCAGYPVATATVAESLPTPHASPPEVSPFIGGHARPPLAFLQHRRPAPRVLLFPA